MLRNVVRKAAASCASPPLIQLFGLQPHLMGSEAQRRKMVDKLQVRNETASREIDVKNKRYKIR